MITRREIIDELASFPMQQSCRDIIDGRIDLEAFRSSIENEFKDIMAAGYRFPAIAAYIMEYGFSKIDQGQEKIKDRLDDALSVIIKSARLKGLLGMMMDMPISGMHDMREQSVPLKEYASTAGFAPLKDVSVLEGDNPPLISLGSREHGWHKELSEIFGSLVYSLMEGTLSLPEFKRRTTNTTGDTTYGFADALFLTMSKGFEYFATRVEQNDTAIVKKLGILKSAISAVISATETDLKQKAAMDDLIKEGIPEAIERAYEKSDMELSAERGYEAIRRLEKVKDMFATRTTMHLYGNEEGENVTPVEYARKMTRHPSAIVAQIARDVVATLKQHDVSQEKG